MVESTKKKLKRTSKIVIDYTQGFEIGLSTTDGVIEVCPECGKKGAYRPSDKPVFWHTVNLLSLPPRRRVKPRQICKIGVSEAKDDESDDGEKMPKKTPVKRGKKNED